MAADFADLSTFVAVARAGGFREAARLGGSSASALSESVRRLEARLGVRLLNRTTRSVAPTEAGTQLLARLGPALAEIASALDVVNGFRERPVGTLRLNVPVSAVRLVLPRIVPPFLVAYPDIQLKDWWLQFSGPFLYYPSRRYVPAPLRAFIEFVQQQGEWRA